ncbi:ATP-dependent Clp protease adaptor [Posidoniimonas polymericola]|uniref:ATP-dependent Clp protease adaptor n=1 Tax=Posidoniimonas polymericola TaxID=2528002 RepID=A0A5C5YAR2_9BACT|nr:ATP-dependent Clp protease adaptor ClpS [Posidoniimonas polymericola]TWT72796.1 ATP-dependent Clp protease adaptor [Posidoniimonas polymericola]
MILHNDDFNGFLFVAESIVKVFGYEPEKAIKLMLRAHETGRSCVWSGMREHAELKADQLRSCGGDPEQAHQNALPLRVTTEPMPA